MHLYEPHTFEWENCWEFQTKFCSNFMWSHLRVGKQKIAKIVAVHWPRWPPCQYMIKTFKNFLLQNQECLGAESLHKLLGTRGLPNLLKEVVRWHLTFLQQGQVCFPMHLYGPHTFEWENCWKFHRTSPLKPLSQICSDFILSLLRLGERKIANLVVVHWPRWPPYMVKPFKNLLLQNRGCLGAESMHKSLGTRDLPKLLKRLCTLTFDLFMARSSLLPYAFVWAP